MVEDLLRVLCRCRCVPRISIPRSPPDTTAERTLASLFIQRLNLASRQHLGITHDALLGRQVGCFARAEADVGGAGDVADCCAGDSGRNRIGQVIVVFEAAGKQGLPALLRRDGVGCEGRHGYAMGAN